MGKTMIAVVLCAWVLWDYSSFLLHPDRSVMARRGEYSPSQSFVSLADCKAAAVATKQGMFGNTVQGVSITEVGVAVMVHVKDAGTLLSVSFTCLPDTVDPRPRGKE